MGTPEVRATRIWFAAAVVATLALVGCGSGDGDDGSTSTTDESPTSSVAPTSGEAAEPTTTAPPEVDPVTLEYGTDFLTVDDMSAVLGDDEGVFALDSERDEVDRDALGLCGQAADSGVVVAGRFEAYQPESGLVSVGMTEAGFASGDADEVWSQLTTAADVEQGCQDFQSDGETMRVDGTGRAIEILQASGGLDATTDEDLLVAYVENPRGVGIHDVLVREGDVIGKIRVVWAPGTVLQDDVAELSAQYVARFRQSYG